nr:hypothetical protein Iba_chr05eCG15130 [Ipomoea batatas]
MRLLLGKSSSQTFKTIISRFQQSPKSKNVTDYHYLPFMLAIASSSPSVLQRCPLISKLVSTSPAEETSKSAKFLPPLVPDLKFPVSKTLGVKKRQIFAGEAGREMKPGTLSHELKEALGMPDQVIAAPSVSVDVFGVLAARASLIMIFKIESNTGTVDELIKIKIDDQNGAKG